MRHNWFSNDGILTSNGDTDIWFELESTQEFNHETFHFMYREAVSDAVRTRKELGMDVGDASLKRELASKIKVKRGDGEVVSKHSPNCWSSQKRIEAVGWQVGFAMSFR